MAAQHSEDMTTSKVSLRPADADDREFLFRVYASTREEEIAALRWDALQAQHFLRMQFDVRHRVYTSAYPAAETSVIEIEGVSAGSMILARSAGEIRLVDIALLPEFRCRGIGQALLRELIAEAGNSRRVLKLSVLRGNRAARLYERMGFLATGGDAMYCEMEFQPIRQAGATGAA